MEEKKAPPDAFSQLISTTRRAQGLSQRQLGRQLQTAKRPNGVWNTYVGQIEKGEKVPSDEVALKLAEVLGLNACDVLLAAYRARSESVQTDVLFRKVERLLADAAVQRLLAEEDAFMQRILEAVSDGADGGALMEKKWCTLLARLSKNPGRDLPGLLRLTEGIEEPQWGAVTKFIEQIKVAS